MTSLRLPDCDAVDLSVALTDEEKRELVLAIAAGGVGAIDEYIAKREGTDSSIARRIKALRAELVRRAEELRKRLAGEFAAAKEARVAAWEEAHAALEAQRDEVTRGMELVRVEGAADVERAAFEVPLARLALEAVSKPAPWWRRAWLRILSFFRWLLSLILAPIAWMTGRRPKARGRTAIVSRRGFAVDLSAARFDPRVRRAVKERLRAKPARERLREAWNRLLTREDYEETVRRLMDEQIADQEREKRESWRRREEEMSRRLGQLTEEEDARRKALDASLERLDRERREAEEALRRDAEREPVDAAKRDVLSALEDAGLVRLSAEGWAVTERLVDRFAEIVLAEETRRMSTSRGRVTGAWSDGEGNWSREPLRTESDLAHMDLLASALRARGRTPLGRDLRLYEEDVVVYREERGAQHHVVIVFDRSGSMEENGRLDAAKRAVLALHHAVKRDSAANRVDVLSMSTSVERVDLVGVWEAEPRGFTNTGSAIKKASDLLRASRAERGIVYLITDGLPEAYTKDGEDYASTPEKCLAYALEQARALRTRQSVELAVILLEADDPLYVQAAEAIAKEVRGRVFKARPEDLAEKMLRDFDRAALRAREVQAARRR